MLFRSGSTAMPRMSRSVRWSTFLAHWLPNLPLTRQMPISYGDKVEYVSRLDLYRETGKMIASIASLYSNRIITLYKVSADELTSTGIATSFTYNFSTNVSEWGDAALSNGWSATVPQNLTNVWITSATAYGKGIKDTIEQNEWARPVPYSASGYNTVTIHLYKRLSSEPQSLPSDLTYRFSTGDMAFASGNNGWSYAIPEVDDEHTPCWEIHATALSTSATDTIATSEWSTPVKIFTEGYSREEIQDMIGERQNETPNITFSPTGGVFAVDEDGKISMSQTAYIDVTVIQNGVYIDFTFGIVDLPDGMTVTTSVLKEGGRRLIFTAGEGIRLRNMVIEIPVNYIQFSEFDVIGDLDGNPFVWVENEDGHWYGNISAVADLPDAPETGGFLYWDSDLDVQSDEDTVKGGVFYTKLYYTYNGTRWQEAETLPLGSAVESVITDTHVINYTISVIAGGRYWGAVKSVSAIPADPIIGDYFTWTGSDGTPFAGSGFTALHSGCVYSWNGQAWVKESSNRHLGTALPDVLSVAEAELAANNSDVVERVAKMIAWETVTNNIKVTGEAFINSTITASLTIGKDSATGKIGTIQSANYSELNHTGWKLTDETAYFRSVVIDGVGNASDLSKLAVSSDVKHTTDTNGNEVVTVTTTAKDGTKTTSSATVVSQGDYLYLGKDYGSSSQSHDKNYTRISKDGLLVADNAVIYGTIYATNGEFSGVLTGASGTFTGSVSAQAFEFSNIEAGDNYKISEWPVESVNLRELSVRFPFKGTVKIDREGVIQGTFSFKLKKADGTITSCGFGKVSVDVNDVLIVEYKDTSRIIASSDGTVFLSISKANPLLKYLCQWNLN